MSDLIYYHTNIDSILNRARDYYENDKEKFREHAKDKYRDLSEEEEGEKNIKREYGKKQIP